MSNSEDVKRAAARVDKDEVIAHLEQEHAKALRESSALREKLTALEGENKALDVKLTDCFSILSTWNNIDSAEAVGRALAAEKERDALRDRCERAEKALADLEHAIDTDAAGRPLEDLLDIARGMLFQHGYGPVLDCLRYAADAIREAKSARASLSPGQPEERLVYHACVSCQEEFLSSKAEPPTHCTSCGGRRFNSLPHCPSCAAKGWIHYSSDKCLLPPTTAAGQPEGEKA